MNLTLLAFRYQRLTLMIVGALMVLGGVSYFSLPATEDPQLTIREAIITTAYPGMSPERVERLITKPLEEAIVQVPEIEEVRSVSQAGLSIIYPKVYDKYFDLDRIFTDLRDRVRDATPNLPDGTRPPLVNDDFGDVAVVTAALTAPDFETATLVDIANHVRDQLYAIPGTKRVDVLGIQEERIYVEVSNARLAGLGLTVDQLAGILADQNIISSGGEIDSGGRSFVVEPTGNFEDIVQIRQLPIPLPDNAGTIRLGDVAEVHRGTIDPPERKAYFNGEPAIIFSIAMDRGRSVLDYGVIVKKRLHELEATLPVGFQIGIATYQAEQVANAVYGVSINVLQTLFIVLAVVVLFLGLRTGLIVGTIVPAVMLITLAIMAFTGMTLERMSLATLVIALGLLVDNGIVVAEDFKRRLEEGADRDEALRLVGKELTVPLLTSSLTTILVFLPLMLAQHSAGEYTRSISLVILISLLTSWLLAMTVTPLLCHHFIRVEATQSDNPASARDNFMKRIFHWMDTRYESILRGVLAHRGVFLCLMAALLFSAVAGIAFVPKKFFPDSDRAQITATIDLPAGVSSRVTDDAVRRIFEALDDKDRFPHIGSVSGYVGFGGPRFVLSLTPIDPAPNKAFFVFNVDSPRHLDATEATLREVFLANFPDLQARPAKMFLGPSDSTKLEYQLRGPDADFLFEQATRLEAIFAAIPGAIDIRHDWENRVPKINVEVDQTSARRVGITSADVSASLDQYFSGRVISEFREGDSTFPIIARAEEAERFNLDRLKTLNIYPQRSADPVPLMQIADFRIENEFARIARRDLSRAITVEARNTTLSAEDMDGLVSEEIAAFRQALPPGYELVSEGVIKESAEGQAALTKNVPLCFAIITVLLVGQFNSFKRTAIILITLPLILIGAVAGLYLFRENFGFMIILGLYALMGILMNNAIVLIDRIDIERSEASQSDLEAIVSACVRRLKPIVMTTLTTVVGLSPLIITGDALFAGMSAAIGIGLFVGTVLTLGVVPVLFSLFFGISPSEKKSQLPSPCQKLVLT